MSERASLGAHGSELAKRAWCGCLFPSHQPSIAKHPCEPVATRTGHPQTKLVVCCGGLWWGGDFRRDGKQRAKAEGVWESVPPLSLVRRFVNLHVAEKSVLADLFSCVACMILSARYL